MLPEESPIGQNQQNNTDKVNFSSNYDQRGQTVGNQTNIIIEISHLPPEVRPLSETQSGQRADFYQHIHMPDNYVIREEAISAIRRKLLDGLGSVAITSMKARVDALHGMGGIGKTVLARALCDDPSVQEAFPHGILWVTLGKTPDLHIHLREWIYELGGIISEGAPTINVFKDTLSKLLNNRKCLLIVDDVWQYTHVAAFRVGGPNCRMLITTRDAEIAQQIEADIYRVDTMTEREAIELLDEWRGKTHYSITHQHKVDIVKRLGYLPLAIRLAGSQLQRTSPVHWLKAFDFYKLRTNRHESVHDSLETTFALSMDELQSEEQQLYVSLVIFKEDEAIPFVAVAKLWSILNPTYANNTEEILNDFDTRALLQIVTDKTVKDEDAMTHKVVNIHDLLRDFIGTRVDQDSKLYLHRSILNAYRQTQSGNGWHTAPDDGYFYSHLSYHLDQIADQDANAEQELKSLFETDKWLHVRVPTSDYEYDGYLADLQVCERRAYLNAKKQIEGGKDATSLADCMLFAIIRTSINSVAHNYDFPVVIRAVELGLWSTRRALGLATRMSDPWQRCQLLRCLLQIEHVDNQLRPRITNLAIEAALLISEPKIQTESLLHLLPYMDKNALCRLLSWALLPTNIQHQSELLIQIISHLKNELPKWAIDAILTINQIDIRCRLMNICAAHINLTAKFISQELSQALSIEDEQLCTECLLEIAPLLSEDMSVKVFEHVEDRNFEVELEVKIVAAITPRLPLELRKQAFEILVASAKYLPLPEILIKNFTNLHPKLQNQVIKITEEISSPVYRVQALINISPHCKPQVRKKILKHGVESVLNIRSSWHRAYCLMKLLPLLDEQTRLDALQAGLQDAWSIKSIKYQIEALVWFVSYLNSPDIDTIIDYAIQTISTTLNDSQTVKLLTMLAPYSTSEDKKKSLLRIAEKVALTLNDDEQRVEALIQIASYSELANLHEVLQTALKSNSDNLLSIILTKLLPKMDKKFVEITLADALTICDADKVQESLNALIPYTAENNEMLRNLLEQEIDRALSMVEDDNDETLILWKIKKLLTKYLTPDLVHYAIEEANATSQTYIEKELVISFAQYLNQNLLQEIIERYIDFEYEENAAGILVALAPYLDQTLLQEIIERYIDFADEENLVDAIVTLAPYLDRALAQKCIAHIYTNVYIQQESRKKLLSMLESQLSKEFIHQVLESICDTTEEERLEFLSELAMYIVKFDLHQQILFDMWHIYKHKHTNKNWWANWFKRNDELPTVPYYDESCCVDLLIALAPYLDQDLLYKTLVVSQEFNDEDKASTIVALAAGLKNQTMRIALDICLGIDDEYYRTQIIDALCPHITRDHVQQALHICLEIEEEYQAECLATLASKMNNESVEIALNACKNMMYSRNQAQVLVAIASLYREDLVQLAFDACLDSNDEEFCLGCLTTLVPKVNDESIEKVLNYILRINTKFHEQPLIRCLIALAPRLTSELVERVMNAIVGMKEDYKVSVLIVLAPSLSAKLIEKALEISLSISSDQARTKCLIALAPKLTSELLERAIDATKRLEEDYQILLQIALNPQLSGELALKILKLKIPIYHHRDGRKDEAEKLLRILIPKIDEDLFEGLFEIMLKGDWSLSYVADLMPDLCNRLLQMKFAMMTSTLPDETEPLLPNELIQTKLIVQTASILRGSTLQKGLELALSMHSDYNRMEALTALAPFLTKEQLPPVIEVTANSRDERQRARLLANLPPMLPTECEEQLLRLALDINRDRNPWDRANVLLSLVPKLSGETQGLAFKTGLVEALDLADEEFDREITFILNQSSFNPLILGGIKAIIDIQDDKSRSYAFYRLLSLQYVYDKLMKDIQLALAEHLFHCLYTADREHLLRLCATDTLFAIPTFPYNVLQSIAGHIENICNQWEWL